MREKAGLGHFRVSTPLATKKPIPVDRAGTESNHSTRMNSGVFALGSVVRSGRLFCSQDTDTKGSHGKNETDNLYRESDGR